MTTVFENVVESGESLVIPQPYLFNNDEYISSDFSYLILQTSQTIRNSYEFDYDGKKFFFKSVRRYDPVTFP